LTRNTAIPEVLATIERIHDDRSIRCVILTGNGPSFSAGGNINEMKRQPTPEVSEMDIRPDERRGIQRLTLALFNLEVPVIAAPNGHAIGAGLGPRVLRRAARGTAAGRAGTCRPHRPA
jgi:enoyl-CoA hydratase/carnithine racemase